MSYALRYWAPLSLLLWQLLLVGFLTALVRHSLFSLVTFQVSWWLRPVFGRDSNPLPAYFKHAALPSELQNGDTPGIEPDGVMRLTAPRLTSVPVGAPRFQVAAYKKSMERTPDFLHQRGPVTRQPLLVSEHCLRWTSLVLHAACQLVAARLKIL